MGKLIDKDGDDLLKVTNKEWLEANIIERSLFHMKLFKYCNRNNINFKEQCDKLGIKLWNGYDPEKQEKE